MLEHCDYQKLDDTLRMVLDCSDGQCSRIKAMLDEYHASGAIAYGIHKTSAAQMTCYVESLSDQGHFHFVDGNDGGYALAARMLKQQLRVRSESICNDEVSGAGYEMIKSVGKGFVIRALVPNKVYSRLC